MYGPDGSQRENQGAEESTKKECFHPGSNGGPFDNDKRTTDSFSRMLSQLSYRSIKFTMKASALAFLCSYGARDDHP